MNAYSDFAAVYDMFMDNVDYMRWKARISDILSSYNINEGIVLDLGCGTGNITELLASEGYDMIGIDSSDSMLQRAIEKRDLTGSDILYLHQDIREFELYGTVRAVVCVCDSINYITDTSDLKRVFDNVHLYLEPEGIFIFDFNTERAYERIADETIAENRDEGSFIWENTYSAEEKMNRCDLTIFVPDGRGRYLKFEEEHVQKAYDKDIIRKLLEDAGFIAEDFFDEYTAGRAHGDSCRISVVAVRSQTNA